MLQCPIIIEDESKYYGGSQEWYQDDWACKAGCGSVCATNVISYYQGITSITKDDYITKMEEIYQYVTPGKMGYPYIYLYARSIGKYLNMKHHIIRNPKLEEGKEFVKKSIDSGNPVSLLVLAHTSFKLGEDKWHWMSVFGYDDKYIYYSSYGKQKRFKMKSLFKPNRINTVKMVSFYTL
ncbi:MAG: C39 family peptidase [Thomasclavelia sp.]|nr:C39 family peptidase [Thomasclavelia sp.]